MGREQVIFDVHEWHFFCGLIIGSQIMQPPLEVALASPLCCGWGGIFCGSEAKIPLTHSMGTDYAAVQAALALPVQSSRLHRLFLAQHSPSYRGTLSVRLIHSVGT